MTKTVELTDLIVTSINLDYGHQCVIVNYDLIDAQQKIWSNGVAFFWVEIPPVPPSQTVPDNWFQLPPSYFPTLLQLQTDADQALSAKFLV